LVSDIVLTLLSWMVEEKRQRIRTAQKRIGIWRYWFTYSWWSWPFKAL